MPHLMSLEGPRVDRIAQLRGQLYSAIPRPAWALSGIFDPFMLNKLWVGVGVVLGMWLAGSKKGQELVAKVAKR
jgi:hypothetical protein